MPAYDPAQVEVDALFNRAHSLEVADIPVMELSPVDSVIYACAHLDLHHRSDPALFRYFEIAALIHNNNLTLDWDMVAQRASQWQTLLPVQKVIEQIARLWPDLVPASAVDALRLPNPSRRERFVDRWLDRTHGRPAFNHLLLWLTFPDWKQRPLILLQDIFPGPEYLRRRYGSPPLGFWPFLYLRRFVRALGSVFGWRDT